MMISVKELTKRYARNTAVDHISFEVQKGEIVGRSVGNPSQCSLAGERWLVNEPDMRGQRLLPHTNNPTTPPQIPGWVEKAEGRAGQSRRTFAAWQLWRGQHHPVWHSSTERLPHRPVQAEFKLLFFR